jgi:hypothetical protein
MPPPFILNDTPVKVRSTLEPQYGMSARNIQDEVADELRGNIRIVPQDDFINNILPGCNIQPGLPIIKKLKQTHYDPKARRWKHFPTDEEHSKEYAFYKPLVQIANAINTECAPYRHGDSVDGEWLDTHSVAPESRNKDRAAIEPDIVYVSRRKDAERLQQKLWKDTEKDPRKLLERRVRLAFDLGFKSCPDSNFIGQAKIQRVWWLHVHTCIEVKAKPSNEKELHNHIIQLCSYMRQMFREQLDRRFVVGLLLCGSELTMWLCDRSGLIGTVRPIDIHEVSSMVS